ncbi:MAG TPA: response regulator transcription factor [Chitinophagaceae bacterium]|nr:response regulator transcription factor [Chitinophagaceae bacterium]
MLRVLIADDHAIVRRGLRQILLEEYPSAIIEETNDAETLMLKVGSGEWDVVICDINMPGRTGLDALQTIKQMSPHLPVLIMSIYPEEQYAIRVLKGGASGYLNKESIHDDLIKAIQTVLQGRKFITPQVAEILAGNVISTGSQPQHESLSDREFEVFKLLAAGQSVSDIAAQLSLSTTTVSTYRARIMEKMNMRSNADLTRYALENKMI